MCPQGATGENTMTFKLLKLAAGAAMLLAGAAHAESFGAISISPETGATGWSFNAQSRWRAEDISQGNCYDYAGDCRVAIWFRNACGAVARGPDGWGADWGESPRSAQRAAIAACSRHSDGCRVIRWQCSGAGY